MTSEEINDIKCRLHKGMSEVLKNIAKTHYYLSEHSIKRY